MIVPGVALARQIGVLAAAGVPGYPSRNWLAGTLIAS